MKTMISHILALLSKCHFKRVLPRRSDLSLYLLLLVSITFSYFFSRYLDHSEIKITILHSDSLAGNMEPKLINSGRYAGEYAGGPSILAGKIRQIKNENKSNLGHTLIFDTGNTFFTGNHNPYRQKDNALLITEVMNLIGYNAMSLRNEDYNFGDDVVGKLAQNSEFTMISTNFTGKNLEKLRPVEILHIGNLKIGILGLTNPNIFNQNFQKIDKTMEQFDLDIALRNSMNYLQKKSVDLTIILSSLQNIDLEISIAKKYAKEVDLIVATCQTDSKCNHPIFVGKIPIIKVPQSVPSIGRIDLNLNLSSKEVINSNWQSYPLLLLQTEKDHRVERLLERNSNNLEQKIYQRVIGRALVHLWDREDGESLFGNFVCDSILKTYEDKADIVFINSSNLQEMPIGGITMENLFRSIPFNNRLVSMRMKGEDIILLLKESFEKKDQIGVLQMAGIRVGYSELQDGEITLNNVMINGAPIKSEQVYNLITTDYLASGGDGYSTFLKGRITKTHHSLKKVLVDFIRNEREIIARADGRIQKWD